MRPELKSIRQYEQVLDIDPQPRISKLGKQWLIAKKKAMQNIKAKNTVTEIYYNLILSFAKSLFATLPDDYSKTVIEKNYREDLSQALSMHSFLTSSFYCELECWLDLHYYIRYDFHFCPFEEQIRSEFERMFHDCPNRLVSGKRLPNCDAYFKRILFAVNKEYIHTL